MVGGQRLRFGHVQRSANATGRQFGDERVSVDDPAAGHVDEKRAVAHGGQEGRVHQVLGGRIEWQREYHHVRRRQQGRQVARGKHALSRGPADDGNRDFEGFEPTLNGTPDSAGANDHDVPVRQRWKIAVVPVARGHAPCRIVDATETGYGQADREFRSARVVHSGGIAEDHALAKVRNRVVVSGGEQLADLQSRHVGHLLQRGRVTHMAGRRTPRRPGRIHR